MTRKNLLISYAQDFASYLLSESYMEKYEIRNIILYGSVVRGNFTKESDIDIFIDTGADNELKNLIKGTVNGFYESLWYKKWERLKIKNQINCLVGKLNEWKDLERSIISNNIILYGTFKPEIKGKIMTMFFIEGVKPESKRVFVNRKMFGYKRYKKIYSGFVQKCNGEKLGKGCFVVPIEFSQKIIQFLRKNKIKAAIREIVLL